MRRVALKVAMEGVTWGLGKLGLMAFTVVAPTLVALAALAWKWIGPLLKWLTG